MVSCLGAICRNNSRLVCFLVGFLFVFLFFVVVVGELTVLFYEHVCVLTVSCKMSFEVLFLHSAQLVILL